MPKDTKECPYLFSTDGGKTAFSAYSKAKDALDNEIAKLRKAEWRDPMSAWQLSRDLRRTAKTLMARAGVRPDISERVLAHVIPASRAYTIATNICPSSGTRSTSSRRSLLTAS
jgi:hypothetical protein